MKLIPLFLLVGMLAVSGWAQVGVQPYSPELVKRAEAGDPVAQHNLATFYQNGDGIAQDYKEAVKWFTKAAEQGEVMAQSNLGWAYYEGRGVAQDFNEAVKWFTKVGEPGNMRGQSGLGMCYY